MDQYPTGSATGVGSPDADAKHGRVWSTGCLLVVLLAVFLAVIVLPALLWVVGIAFGQ